MLNKFIYLYYMGPCINIFGLQIQGITIIWILLIILNFIFLFVSSLQYNPLEPLTNPIKHNIIS